jgi:hypothetical protein
LGHRRLFGAFLAPHSDWVNKVETFVRKFGASVGVFIVTTILRLFLVKSTRLMLIALVAIECIALIVIVFFTGLYQFTVLNIEFNIGWLFTLTWNVVLLFIIGTWVGSIIKVKKPIHRT